ncbi:MAG TPA: hypothetical protein VGN55_17175 [Xanthobacteraceae bacterium]
MSNNLQAPLPPIPPRPPEQRNGCLTALMILGGIVLLLPGICAVMIVGFDSSVLRDATTVSIGVTFLAISAGGIVLIWFAIRPPR